MSTEFTIILDGKRKLTIDTVQGCGIGEPPIEALIAIKVIHPHKDDKDDTTSPSLAALATRTETLALAAALKEVGSKLKK